MPHGFHTASKFGQSQMHFDNELCECQRKVKQTSGRCTCVVRRISPSTILSMLSDYTSGQNAACI